jgi:Tol biopolymer transport system component
VERETEASRGAAPAQPGAKENASRRLAAGLSIVAVATAGWLLGNIAPTQPAVQLASSAVPRIAFLAGRPPGGILGRGDIYVVHPDGGELLQLTHMKGSIGELAWSPDGSTILVALGPGTSRPWNIYSMDLAGRLTKLTDGSSFDQNPTWSPDGRRIAFTSDRPGNPNYEIYVMDADGANLTRLTDDPGIDTEPDWSPDGRQIAFVSSRHGLPGRDNWEIFVMDADGSGVRPLTEDPYFDHDPSWAPDGSRIAFSVRGAENSDAIVAISPDGTGATALFECRGSCLGILGGPAWSPDGRRIAFTVEVDAPEGAVQRINVMDADGGNLARLDTGPFDACCPTWQGAGPGA